MALSRGAGLKREGPSGTAPGKAWPLLFGDSAHPLGAQSEDGVDGDAGTEGAQGLSDDFPGSNGIAIKDGKRMGRY